MIIKLIRHATLTIQTNGIKLLVDPMLSPKETLKAIESKTTRRNPIIDLPIAPQELDSLINSIDGVLLTHTHFDHFDEAAERLIPKDIPLFCQPVDKENLSGLGFTSVYPVEDSLTFRSINIVRTSGQHGTGETGEKMGKVSGYVLQSKEEPSVYITGDTIWCGGVEAALQLYKPVLVVAFAGAAQFLTGGPITMTAEGVQRICETSPKSKVIAVHMEALNHCLLMRNDLRNFIKNAKLTDNVLIPEDGESMEFKREDFNL